MRLLTLLCVSIFALGGYSQDQQDTISEQNALDLVQKGTVSADTTLSLSPLPEEENPGPEQLWSLGSSLVLGNHSVGGRFYLDQSWDPKPGTKHVRMDNDAKVHYNYRWSRFLGEQSYLKPSFTGHFYFPNSEASQRDQQVFRTRGDIRLAGSASIFTYGYTFMTNYRRHKYQNKTITAGGGYLSDYDYRNSVDLSTEIVSGLSLDLAATSMLFHYYDNYYKASYEFSQGLSYQISPSWGVEVAHTVGGDTLVDRGTKRNIKFYDPDLSTFSIGIKYEWVFHNKPQGEL